MYWLLTGEPVFDGRTGSDMLRQIQCDHDFPRPAAALDASIPTAVDCVVWKALQKEPARRYENCKVLAEELHCCLSGKKPNAQLRREGRRKKMNAARKGERAESTDSVNKALAPED